MKARVIATKCDYVNLKPGDLFTEYGPDYWNQAMNRGLPAASVFIRTNSPVEDDDTIFYRLTIAIEDEGGRLDRNEHVKQAEHSPFSPPGVHYGDYVGKVK